MARSNKILFRVVIGLLCATLLTTSVISTTFAKYTAASGQSSTSARVATWSGNISGDDEENVIKMKPGTSGEIVRARASGVSEVLHVATLSSINASMDLGYRGIDSGKDYFPLLITVGMDKNGSPYEEKYFYMMMPSVDDDWDSDPITTVDELIAKIAAYSGGLSQYVDPNESLPVEFYVKWRWFYNDADINSSSLDENIKERMMEYQDPAKDTLLGEAMRIRAAFNEIINADGNDAKYTTLKNLVEQYKDVTEPTEDQVTALSNALADFFGETATEYRYTKQENYDIRWRGIINSGHKTVYDPYGVVTSYGSYFDPAPITDSYMYTSPDTSDAGKALNNALCNYASICFYSVPERNSSKQVVANGATIPLVEGLTYEYYFKAKNTLNTRYAGVVFAIDQNDIPYFLYGAFTNGATDETSGSYVNQFELSIGYDHYPHPDQKVSEGHPEGYAKLSSAVQKKYNVVYAVGGSSSDPNVNYNLHGKVAEEDGYGLYKIVYEGFNVSCYYKDATTGEYKQVGTTITLPEGSRFSVGVLSRKGYGATTERTVQITGASFVQEKEIVSVSTTFNSLMKRIQSVITACESGPFDVRVNLGVTMQQVQSKEYD